MVLMSLVPRPARREPHRITSRAGRLAAGAGALCIAAAGPALAAGAPIQVTVTGVTSTAGSVRVDVCTRETFLHTTCPYSGAAPARVGETVVTVPDVPPGVYALQAYHDRNDNLDVEQGFLGIPQEGVGFSREPRLGMRGPSFDAAAIAHGDALQPITIRLKFEPRAGT
jgi:uncharacterized protein (DUF2141 family)